MTFVIAKIIDPSTGKVSLLADTKLTHIHDDTLTRRTLANPFQKVVIVDDDVVVGIAGDTPESALKAVVELRGQSVEAIEEALMSFTAEMQSVRDVSKKFLLVARTPSPRIIVINNGTREDRTSIGTGWVGDDEAFRSYSRIFQDEGLHQNASVERRFLMSTALLVVTEDVASVGGYLVRVTGSRTKPFRFGADPGRVLPDDLQASFSPGSGDSVEFELSLPTGADATTYVRLPIPGLPPTIGALAHYIPESGAAWLHTHEEPWRTPVRLKVESVSELIDVANDQYGQILDRDLAEYVFAKYGSDPFA